MVKFHIVTMSLLVNFSSADDLNMFEETKSQPKAARNLFRSWIEKNKFGRSACQICLKSAEKRSPGTKLGRYFSIKRRSASSHLAKSCSKPDLRILRDDQFRRSFELKKEKNKTQSFFTPRFPRVFLKTHQQPKLINSIRLGDSVHEGNKDSTQQIVDQNQTFSSSSKSSYFVEPLILSVSGAAAKRCMFPCKF